MCDARLKPYFTACKPNPHPGADNGERPQPVGVMGVLRPQ
jgi:hypothetical protein